MLELSVEELEKRVANISSQIEQMAENIRLLNGSKLTMEGLLMEAKKAAEIAKDATQEVKMDAAEEVAQ